MSNHEHHHHEDECCAHEAAPTEITLNASAAGNLQTTLQVAGVDCAEEVSLIQRALKPLGRCARSASEHHVGQSNHCPRRKRSAGSFD
jgi:hypothetical protein